MLIVYLNISLILWTYLLSLGYYRKNFESIQLYYSVFALMASKLAISETVELEGAGESEEVGGFVVSVLGASVMRL